MRFKIGELVVPREPGCQTTVWKDDLNDEEDFLDPDDVATVCKSEDSYGWVYVITPRGKRGVVHRSNIVRPAV